MGISGDVERITPANVHKVFRTMPGTHTVVKGLATIIISVIS